MTKIEVVKKKLKIVTTKIKVIKKKIEDSYKKIKVENNVPPAQLQKTPLSRKGILAAVPIR